MTDTVDLIVVGVEGDIPRADMSSSLVKQFKQEAYMFEALLDGAYGESAPYAAQTDVERSLAEDGKAQLEKLGLICTILPTGEKPEPAAIPAAPPVDSAEKTSASISDLDTDNADSALASFKSGDEIVEEAVESDEVSFDIDEVSSGDSALASFKKGAEKDNKSSSNEVDFSDDMESVAADSDALGLADAKQAKNNVAELDDSINHDFSDQIEDVGADKIASGLKEAQKAKPDFNADVEDVDFSDHVGSIGIHEKDPLTPEVSKSKLEEEAAERNLNSFPKEDTETSIDFSDELEILSSGPAPAEFDGVANKADVPEALADAASLDLEADLIDPAPIEKEEKAPVEIDDGGLSLSADNDAPLTAPKEKSTEVVDDGGLSLSEDSAAPLTTPKKKADPAAADDGGLNLADAAESAEANTDNAVADNAAKAVNDSADDAPLSGSDSKSGSETSDPATAVASDAPVEQPAIAKEPAPAEKPVSAEKPAPAAPVEEIKPAAAAKLPEPAVAPAVAPAAKQSGTVEEPPQEPAKAPKEVVATSGGLVLPGQLSHSVVPEIVNEDDLDDVSSSATQSLREVMPVREASDDAQPDAAQVANDAIENAQNTSGKKSKKKMVAALAGIVVLGGAGSFAFMNAGSIEPVRASLSAAKDLSAVKDSKGLVDKMRVEVAELRPDADLENLSTGELLENLSDNRSNGLIDLEPYFLESGDQVKRGPRIGAAIPAESAWMIRNRQPHPADQYFDEWSNRDADLSLFLALFDNLIEKGDLEVAQQLSDRAKDKLFSVMSTQRLARAYSDVGERTQVTRLMALANRDTYAIKAPEERVLALSDYAFTEQAIGLNEDAKDTFLKTSILARSLIKPETRAVGLSSAAIYFHRSGRTGQAQDMLTQALQAGNELPKNTAAKDLAIRFIALSEARMGLFNQALEHTELIVDPIASVSAYHGIALAIESTGDDTNARKVLNMAYRAGSQIEDPEERDNLLSKVVLASESE